MATVSINQLHSGNAGIVDNNIEAADICCSSVDNFDAGVP
jgi:hypothetical protein